MPGHVGIAGNELADAAARRAASVPCTRRLPLPARDLCPSSAVVGRSLMLAALMGRTNEEQAQTGQAHPRIVAL